MSGFSEFGKREAEIMARPVVERVYVEEPRAPVFEVEVGGLYCHFKVTVLKHRVPVDVKTLTSDEKTEVIELFMQTMSTEANHAWEEAMGEDL